MARVEITRLALLAVAGLAVIALVSSRPPRFVWNTTPSVPLGLYEIVDPDMRRGALVAVNPDSRIRAVLDVAGVVSAERLLLKTIAAIEGDQVCRLGREVTINGAHVGDVMPQSQSGRDLPAWDGCVDLGANQVFLMNDVERSLDGRYFGVSSLDVVVGTAQPVLTWRRGDK